MMEPLDGVAGPDKLDAAAAGLAVAVWSEATPAEETADTAVTLADRDGLLGIVG